MRISDWSSDVCSSDLINGDEEMTKTSPGSIEDDLRSTRRNVEDDMEDSGDIVNSVMDFARSNAGGVGRMVREHPLPVAMIGAGIVWLALASRSDHDDDLDVTEFRSEENKYELQSLTRNAF